MKLHWLMSCPWLLSLLAISLTACQSGNTGKTDPAGQSFFIDANQTRDVQRFAIQQTAAGARAEATFYSRDFDTATLNALGHNKLDLMLREMPAGNPPTIYLALSADDSLAAQRRSALEKALSDRGQLAAAIPVKPGVNPDTLHPAVPELQRLPKTENGSLTNTPVSPMPQPPSPSYKNLTDQPR